MGRAYRAQIDNGNATTEFWKVAGAAFEDTKAELKAATNPLEAFAQSEELLFQAGSYMKLQDFKEQARAFSKKRGLPAPCLSQDALADVLNPRNVSCSIKQRRQVGNMVHNTKWLDGVETMQE